MAAAFTKLFKKKNNKENNEPQKKCSNSSASAPPASSSMSAVYMGGDYSKPRGGSARDAFAGPQSKWKYVSPYAIVTEPKTRKPTRSCPGAPTYSESYRSGGGARRYLSPDYGRRIHYSNKHPTIFEVSGSYENYPHESSGRVESLDISDGETLNVNNKRQPANKSASGYHNKSNSRTQQQRVLTTRNQQECGSLRERASFQRQPLNRQSLNLKHLYKTAAAVGSGGGSAVVGGEHNKRVMYNHAPRQNAILPSTSEYGSADPSPTNNNNQPSGVVAPKSFADNLLRFDENSFENTDYDSDSDDSMPFTIVDICEQQLRKVTAERNHLKEKARQYKRKYMDVRVKYEGVVEKLDYEKRKNHLVNAELEKTKKDMENFRNFINQQFRNINGHYRNQKKQQQEQQQLQMIMRQQQLHSDGEQLQQQQAQQQQQHLPQKQQLLQQQEQLSQQQPIQYDEYQNNKEEAYCASLQDHSLCQANNNNNSNNNNWKDESLAENNSNYKLLGAGEALCSRTELFEEENDGFTKNFFSSVFSMNSAASAPNGLSNKTHVSFSEASTSKLADEMNEIKIFRNPKFQEDKDLSFSYNGLEEARASSIDTIAKGQNANMDSRQPLACGYFSPPSFGRRKNEGVAELLTDEEDVRAHNNNQLRSSTQEAKPDNETSSLDVARRDFNASEASSDDSLNIREHIRKRKAKRRAPPAPPPRQGSALLTRKSFSETDLASICLNLRKDNANERDGANEAENVDAENDAVDVVNDQDKSLSGNARRNKRIVGFEDDAEFKEASDARQTIPKYRYCRYSPKRNGEHSSSYSSDDDAIRIFARQLRRRGELVHFQPPRKNLAGFERKLFRRFGSGERNAIAQFDYLKEMPTDVSGLVSSPGSQ